MNKEQLRKLIKEELKAVLNEDGHTDVSSARRQAKLAIEDSQDILQHLEGFSAEQDLPSWWMKKVALASAYLNSARDYLLTSGEPVNEMGARQHAPSIAIRAAKRCRILEPRYEEANSAVAINPADVVAIDRHRRIKKEAEKLGCDWLREL